MHKKLLFFESPKLWKTSATASVSLVAFIATSMGILGTTLKDVFPSLSWLSLLVFNIAMYIVLTTIIYIAIGLKTKNGIALTLNGIDVNIRQGDLFKAKGWKVISFNEYYDTVVDDVIIARNSLNGIFINEYVEDIGDLEKAITESGISFLANAGEKKTQSYPLGTIKTYKDYMLLAFTRFNKRNEAYLSRSDYEKCLRKMWTEISRTYANKPVALPLLGSGITRFDNSSDKSNLELLKCMLCTLKSSGGKINKPITILLTKETMQNINIYETKGMV